jgi:hypothetical protein
VVISQVYREIGDTDAALRHLEVVRDLAISRRLPLSIRSVSGDPRVSNWRRGRADEALAAYRQSVDSCRRARYVEGLVQSLRGLGEALFRAAAFRRSARSVARGERPAGPVGGPSTELVVWRRLAMAWTRWIAGANPRSHGNAVRALQERRVTPPAKSPLWTVSPVWRVGAAIWQPPSHMSREARELAGATGDDARTLAALNTLGVLYWESGRP